MILYKKKLKLIIFPLIIIFITPSLFATSTKSERQTLKGLKGVQVVVQELTQGEVTTAIDKTALKTEIENFILNEGLEIHDTSKAIYEGNILVATISVQKPSKELKNISDWNVYTVELALRQRVNLLRRRWIKCSAITWIATLTGVADNHGLNEAVKKNTFLSLEKFIADLKEVNQ